MINSTQVSYFIFSAYADNGNFAYFFFLVVMFLYILNLFSNLLLIVVICLNRSLHEPMYIFLCSLFLNELYGTTGVFPLLLVQILSDFHTITAAFCFLQIFCVYSYANIQFFNLAVMSYDRYLAICCPLQYKKRMTVKLVAALIALIWIYPLIDAASMISLTVPLQLCGNIIDKTYCGNYSVVKLACSGTSNLNINEIVGTFMLLFCPLSLIIYTYTQILKVCFSGSKQRRQKAVSTCTPHFASLLNFIFGVSFEVIHSRFDMNNVPYWLHTFLSLYWVTCQPLLNPLLYGLRMSKIRSLCKSLVFGKK